jgi:hypothetical protein
MKDFLETFLSDNPSPGQVPTSTQDAAPVQPTTPPSPTTPSPLPPSPLASTPTPPQPTSPTPPSPPAAPPPAATPLTPCQPSPAVLLDEPEARALLADLQAYCDKARPTPNPTWESVGRICLDVVLESRDLDDLRDRCEFMKQIARGMPAVSERGIGKRKSQ